MVPLHSIRSASYSLYSLDDNYIHTSFLICGFSLIILLAISRLRTNLY